MLFGLLIVILQIIFVLAKLNHNIDWEWWVVFAPIWGGAALALGTLIIIALLALGGILIADHLDRR